MVFHRRWIALRKVRSWEIRWKHGWLLAIGRWRFAFGVLLLAFCFWRFAVGVWPLAISVLSVEPIFAAQLRLWALREIQSNLQLAIRLPCHLAIRETGYCTAHDRRRFNETDRLSTQCDLLVHRLPFTVYCSPFTVHRSLITAHCLPFTVYRSLFTVHCLPFTVYRSQVTGHRPTARTSPSFDTAMLLSTPTHLRLWRCCHCEVEVLLQRRPFLPHPG